MRWAARGTYLWPGLVRLWWRHEFSALVTAGLFAVLVNGVLLATFVYPWWAPWWLDLAAWLAVGICWSWGLWQNHRAYPAPADDDRAAAQQALFIQAQTEYLRGHWFEAQALVEKLLHDDSQDVDARLLLASLLRRTRRFGPAQRQLRELERQEGAEKWRLEMERERQWLEQAAARQAESAGSGASQDQPSLGVSEAA